MGVKGYSLTPTKTTCSRRCKVHYDKKR